jgi:hypothetical protein
MGRAVINQHPWCVDTFFEGTYTTDISEDENEYRQGDFEFVLRYSKFTDGDLIEVSIEWKEEEPPNLEAAEEEIEQKFLSQNGLA